MNADQVAAFMSQVMTIIIIVFFLYVIYITP